MSVDNLLERAESKTAKINNNNNNKNNNKDNNNNNDSKISTKNENEEKSLFPSIEIPASVLPWKSNETKQQVVKKFKRKKGNLDQLLANVEAKKRREDELLQIAKDEKSFTKYDQNDAFSSTITHENESNDESICERELSLTKMVQQQPTLKKFNQNEMYMHARKRQTTHSPPHTIEQRKSSTYIYEERNIPSVIPPQDYQRPESAFTSIAKHHNLAKHSRKPITVQIKEPQRPVSAFRPIMTHSKRQESSRSSYTSHNNVQNSTAYVMSDLNNTKKSSSCIMSDFHASSDTHRPTTYQKQSKGQTASISTDTALSSKTSEPVRYVFESPQGKFKDGKKANKRTLSAKERYAKLSNSQLQRRLVANARERSRVHALSTAFNSLRCAIPSYSTEQKLSKLTILRVAINYINALENVLQQEPECCGTSPEFERYVDECSSVLQTEYGRSKSKHGIDATM